ncbi:hypothetical protein, partial [Desulfocastanea catecholica]
MGLDFELLQEYFQSLDAGSELVDLNGYYDKKALILDKVLTRYSEIHAVHIPDLMKHSDRLFGLAGHDDTISSGGERSILPSAGEEPIKPTNYEEVLITVYQWMTLDNYIAPSSLGIVLYIHIMALSIFYSVVRPERISHETLFKFDLAALDLCVNATRLSELTPFAVTKLKHSRSVSIGRTRQGNATGQDILEVYKTIGANWTDSKKPIAVGDESYSINKFALQKI